MIGKSGNLLIIGVKLPRKAKHSRLILSLCSAGSLLAADSLYYLYGITLNERIIQG